MSWFQEKAEAPALHALFVAQFLRWRVRAARRNNACVARQRAYERRLSRERTPARRFSTLTSSSRSGQWRPSPRAIRRQRARSRVVPCLSRGYQDSGTVTVRPSVRSTTSATRVTRARSARGFSRLIVEVLIPTPQNRLAVMQHDPLQRANLVCRESMVRLQSYRVEPDLGRPPATFHVHMRWLSSISSIEEEANRSNSKNGRHRSWEAPGEP